MVVLTAFACLVAARDSGYIKVSAKGVGNCFEEPCNFESAAIILRIADIVQISDRRITPTSYPCEWTDLLESAVQQNVTIESEAGTTIDGSSLTGQSMYYLEAQRRFTWGKLKGFTFRRFSKVLVARTHAWTTYPQLVFEDCVFEDSTHDLFSASGGHFVFVNCQFRNISGRPFKALSETTVEFIDCTFEYCESLFAWGADVIIRNCVFRHMTGQRGGAIYAAKTTLYVNASKFIQCEASVSGGAIYIRDSHEKYQSEVSNSCFLGNTAKTNGTSIYAYLSTLAVNKNVFSEAEPIFAFNSHIEEDIDNKKQGNADACIRAHQPWQLPDQFEPCDTFQRHETDTHDGYIYLDYDNQEDPVEIGND